MHLSWQIFLLTKDPYFCKRKATLIYSTNHSCNVAFMESVVKGYLLKVLILLLSDSKNPSEIPCLRYFSFLAKRNLSLFQFPCYSSVDSLFMGYANLNFSPTE
jgi:hypothetical protein